MTAADPDSIFGVPTRPEDAAVIIVPVPFAATVSYGQGAADGPGAVLAASQQVDLFDLETGAPTEAGVVMLPIPAQVRAWHEEARPLVQAVVKGGGPGQDASLRDAAARVDALGAQVNAWVGEQVRAWQGRGKLVGVLGGDHSVPFAHLEACAARWPGLGVLHIDAHADLRVAYQDFTWSHASIFHNVLERCPGVARVVGVGYRDLCREEFERLETDPRLSAFPDPLLRRRLQEGAPWAELAGEIVGALPRQVYVSFDIDGLDPALCPNTGTPVPGGLAFAEATALLRLIVESGREVVGFDLCEVAPDPAGASEWDANVGARVLFKLIGFALQSRPRA